MGLTPVTPNDIARKLNDPALGNDLTKVQAALKKFKERRLELVESLNVTPHLRHLWERVYRSAYLSGLYDGRREVIEQLDKVGYTLKQPE